MLYFEHSFIWCWNLDRTRKVDQNYVESLEMCWRRIEKNGWTDGVRITQSLSQGGKNILHVIKRRKVKWIGHIWGGNCLLKHVIERKLEGRVALLGGRGRRFQMLLVDLQKMTEYWKWKGEALLKACKSVHHHTFNWINQPDAANSQVYYLPPKYSSTGFGHPHAHHQELHQLQ